MATKVDIMWPSSTSVPSTTTVVPQVPSRLPPQQAPPDLLAHRYRPTSIDSLNCHREQAKRLKQWILDFTNAPRNVNTGRGANGSQSSSDSDYDDCDGPMSDDSDVEDTSARRCVLLTGPPGVGKTSLVYMIASELRMHIVESHSSEKRDFRLFKTLKLANQKGKINPIARLFQMTQQKQQTQTIDISDSVPKSQQRNSKRKRRKLDTNGIAGNTNDTNQKQDGNKSQCLSLSGGSSVVLFDDADVAFEEDGPFLKSLAEFIRDSKRPVIVTATRSIEHIKSTLVHFEHIQLNRPQVDDCARILRDVCRKEKYHKLDKVTNCRIIAKKLNCDIRQCLNRIHFYGNEAHINIESDLSDIQSLTPNFSRLGDMLENSQTVIIETKTKKAQQEEREDDEDEDDKTDVEDNAPAVDVDDNDDEATIVYTHLFPAKRDVTPNTLECYNTTSLIDLMDSAFNFVDRSTLLSHWLCGKPSNRYEGQSCDHTLGEQIRQSINELTRNLYEDDLIADDDEHHRGGTTTPGNNSACFIDLKASLGTNEQTPLPIASRLRLRPRQSTRRASGGLLSPTLSSSIDFPDGY